MSDMRVPITDAFDETEHLESIEVELTRKQVEWLREKADERNLSLDHVLRSVVTAQIRAQNGDGSASPPPTPQNGQSSSTTSPDDGQADAPAADDSPSIVDSLRSASERLQDLTEQDDAAETPDPHDTLARLQARLGEDEDTDETADQDPPGTVLLDNQNRSMFDMMEEE
jgi:hypothetical protein